MKINCSLAASYFMQSAALLDLGTCWINFGTVITSLEILNELGIPDDCEIVAPIMVGYPIEIPDMPRRKDPEILKVI
ncbi:MAG: nitroreductase family protein [Halanaerobiales bacterium]|nr:nitroreductase family protein [Halanaerobiales bacterium]